MEQLPANLREAAAGREPDAPAARPQAREAAAQAGPSLEPRQLKRNGGQVVRNAAWDRITAAIDNAVGKGEIWRIMNHPQRAAQKKLDYPGETPGSRLAAKARKLASKLTPEQRREHFNGAMTMIYGGAKEATLARR